MGGPRKPAKGRSRGGRSGTGQTTVRPSWVGSLTEDQAAPVGREASGGAEIPAVVAGPGWEPGPEGAAVGTPDRDDGRDRGEAGGP